MRTRLTKRLISLTVPPAAEIITASRLSQWMAVREPLLPHSRSPNVPEDDGERRGGLRHVRVRAETVSRPVRRRHVQSRCTELDTVSAAGVCCQVARQG